MDEEVLELLQQCKKAMANARLNKYSNVEDLFDAECAIEDYLDMVNRLYTGYVNLDEIWK